MPRLLRPVLSALAGATVLAGALAPFAAARTWVVDADAAPGGSGSAARPFDTLAAVERRSLPGDRIVVRPATKALHGGIALKSRQKLVGTGPPVVSQTRALQEPRLTNTDPARLHGDVVRLAEGVEVRNLAIDGSVRGGIYGLDVGRATITGNDVEGHGTACVDGFLIPPFNVPLLVPGTGLPISNGLKNGWAGIMVDAAKGTGKVTINANRVQRAPCGDGIDVRISGAASYRVRIGGNDIRDLRESEKHDSVLAIGMQTRDRGRLVARLDDNRQSGLGNDEDVGAGPSGADSEGIFVNPVGPSSIRVLVTRNRYTHTPGRGGFSANGLEFVAMGDGSRGLVEVRDSTFSGTPGDILEQLALGTNARLRLRLRDVVATGSTGFAGSNFGDTVIVPGNNGDCLLSASGGAGNLVDVRVVRTELTKCANNGLTLGSAVANGSGPSTEVRAHVADSTLTHNRGANIRIANLTELGTMAVLVERTDLGDARNSTSSPANLVAEEFGSTERASIDLGGGSLGSAGLNCLDGGSLGAALVGYDVSARRTWWGTPGGPAPGRVAAARANLDAAEPLAAPPAGCEQTG